MSTTTEYMREYRRSGRDRSHKARTRAMGKAVSWVIAEHPDVWRQLLGEARESLGMPVEVAPKGSFTKPIAHGTRAGYFAERYRGLNPCDDCREAQNAYHRQLRSKKRATS